MFYGLPVVEFLKLVYSYAVACGRQAIPEAWEKGQQATRDWYYVLMKCHPTLTLKSPEGMSITRITAFNRTNVGLFSNIYIEAMDKYNFSANRIFNLDESSLSTVMKPVKVVCKRGKPVASQISHERGASITFVGIINAAGTFIPPVFILPRKRWNDSFMRGTTDGSKGILHQNDWMNGERFLETLQHVPKRTHCSPDKKIILIMNNAVCHMNIHAVEYAIENGIVIVTLPPHTTAKLQSLDVSVFGLFKTHLQAIQNDFYLMHSNTHFTEHKLPEFVYKAWLKASNPSNILNGFAATGIWLVDRNIFPAEVFAGSEITDQPPPQIVAEEEQGLDMNLDAALPSSPRPSTSAHSDNEFLEPRTSGSSSLLSLSLPPPPELSASASGLQVTTQ